MATFHSAPAPKVSDRQQLAESFALALVDPESGDEYTDAVFALLWQCATPSEFFARSGWPSTSISSRALSVFLIGKNMNKLPVSVLDRLEDAAARLIQTAENYLETTLALCASDILLTVEATPDPVPGNVIMRPTWRESSNEGLWLLRA